MSKLKISVIVPGRLHAFEMAIYFQKYGYLNQLVTGYPTKYVVPFGIKKKYIKSLYVNELINRTTNLLGIGYPLDYLACQSFDYLASITIKFDSDIYYIWSGYGLATIKKVRQKNPKAKVILVRGSAHIEEQDKLLKKISESKKIKINPKIICKELQEYELADYITVPSTFAFKTFVEKGIAPNKLFLNILGVDLKQFPFKKKEISSTKQVNLGFVGTLSSRKNIDSIIKVINILNVNQEYKLILAGPIDHQTFNNSLIKKFDFIEYLGKIDQQNLHLVYEKIDVFILNSVEDGFGMVLLQAMSSGCPIIATTNSGGPDIIKDHENGITIPAFSDNDLEKALIWFKNNKSNIPSMGLKSRVISENGFTWDDFGERNIDFINKILQI